MRIRAIGDHNLGCKWSWSTNWKRYTFTYTAQIKKYQTNTAYTGRPPASDRVDAAIWAQRQGKAMQPRQWQSQGWASCGPGKDKRQGKGKGKGQGRGKGRGGGRGRGKAKAIRLRQRQGNMPANGDHDSAAVAAEGSGVDGCGYDANQYYTATTKPK